MSHVAVMRRCRQARRDVGSGAGERSAQYILSRLIIVRRDDHHDFSMVPERPNVLDIAHHYPLMRYISSFGCGSSCRSV